MKLKNIVGVQLETAENCIGTFWFSFGIHRAYVVELLHQSTKKSVFQFVWSQCSFAYLLNQLELV